MRQSLKSLSFEPIKLDLSPYPVSLELYLLLLCNLCRIFKRLQLDLLRLIDLELILILFELLLQSLLLLRVIIYVLYYVETARFITL
jgi:hypothetical protein